MGNEERWYSWDGRIRRITWVTRVFGVGFCFALFVGLLVVISDAMRGSGDHIGDIMLIPMLGAFLGFIVFRFIQDVKRLHDIGQSGLWVICAFIPIISLIYVLFLIFADGQPFTNQYGPDPKGRGGDGDIDRVADVFR